MTQWRTSGQYERTRLLELAASADAGFDRDRFADALGALQQITDADFDLCGLEANELAAIRKRFADWRKQLRDGPSHT